MKDIDITREIRCSTNPDDFKDLQNYFGRIAIVEELNHLKDFYFDDMDRYNVTQARPLLVNALCEWRQLFFDTYPIEYEFRFNSVQDLAESEAETTTEKRSEQIQSKLYSLDPDIVEKYRNT